MSEKLHTKEHEKTSETLDASEESAKNLERIRNTAETESQPKPEEIQSLDKQTKEKAERSQDVNIGDIESDEPDVPVHGTYNKLKTEAYKNSLKKIQSKLPPVQRTFSRIIHKPIVEMISEPLAKTAARPSGVLGAGLFTLIGSGWLLYISKTYGFAYNLFIFFVLIAAGFIFGITSELVIRFVKSKR